MPLPAVPKRLARFGRRLVNPGPAVSVTVRFSPHPAILDAYQTFVGSVDVDVVQLRWIAYVCNVQTGRLAIARATTHTQVHRCHTSRYRHGGVNRPGFCSVGGSSHLTSPRNSWSASASAKSTGGRREPAPSRERPGPAAGDVADSAATCRPGAAGSGQKFGELAGRLCGDSHRRR